MLMVQAGLSFLLLFCSQWFKFYSLFLAGERRNRIGTKLEHVLCEHASSDFFDRVLNTCSNLWFLTNYLTEIYSKHAITKLSNIVLPVTMFRGLVLLIELRLACTRIIDLDVEERMATQIG